MTGKLEMHGRLSVLEVKVANLEERLEIAEDAVEQMTPHLKALEKRLKDIEEAMASIYPSARKRAQ